jgi:hypothetical protein
VVFNCGILIFPFFYYNDLSKRLYAQLKK